MIPLLRKTQWLLLIGGDLAVFYFALWVTLTIRYESPVVTQAWSQHFVPFSLLYAAWIVIFYIFGLYDLTAAKNNLAFYIALGKALFISATVGATFFYLIPFFAISPKTNLFLDIILVFFFFSLWRQTYNFFVRRPFLPQNLIIIGETPHTAELEHHFSQNPQLGYSIQGVFPPHEEQLLSSLQNYTEYTILTAFSFHQYPQLAKNLFENLTKFSLADFSSFYEKLTGKVPLSQIDEIWFLNNLNENDRSVYEGMKRLYDIGIALLIGAIAILIFPIIALAIKLESPGPILYSQKRIGKDGKEFSLWKFRSMVQSAENNHAVWAKKNDPRITRVGKILRKTFIDEFPQSINILKGDLSFIGPRPERPEFVEELKEHIPFYQVRHIVKPGVTGWAQVSFRYGNSTEEALEKLQYELYYIKNRSLVLDLKILLKTINVLFKGGTQ